MPPLPIHFDTPLPIYTDKSIERQSTEGGLSDFKCSRVYNVQGCKSPPEGGDSSGKVTLPRAFSMREGVKGISNPSGCMQPQGSFLFFI
jgi:hypothetical protein